MKIPGLYPGFFTVESILEEFDYLPFNTGDVEKKKMSYDLFAKLKQVA